MFKKNDSNILQKANSKAQLLEIANRLRIFIVKLGVDMKQFSLDTGIKYDNLGKIIQCGTDFGISNLCKIVERYPDLNIKWLLTGEGDCIQEGNSVTITNCRNSSNIGNVHSDSTTIISQLIIQNSQLIAQVNSLTELANNFQKLLQNNSK